MTVAAPTAVTPDDVDRMGEAGKGYEVVDGDLVEVHMSKKSSHVGQNIAHHFGLHARERQPGYVYGEGAGFVCFADDPDRLRKPDAAFVPFERMTPAQYDEPGYCEAVPSVIAEVVSPNDLVADLDRRVEEWLAAGVSLVWVVNPVTRTVRVYQADGHDRTLREPADLTGNGVLTGFAIPLAAVFWRPGT